MEKYAKIWDLCSDMDKYIFQSASDRSIFAPKSQGNNDTKSINDNDSLVKLADIVEKYKIPETNKSKEKDLPSKVESIIDFPTFLLHCYKLWVAKKCKYKIEKITITQDKLLEIMWDNKVKNEEIVCCKDFIFNGKDSSNAKQNCKKFIIFMLQIRVLFDYFVIKNNKKLIEKGKNPYAIKRLDKDNNGYYSVADSNVLEKLAMIQNYLRVARQGERQNYHHWLTPFLRFLDVKEVINKECLTFEPIKLWKPDEISKQFVKNDDNIQDDLKNELVKFLENLDTKLAVAQLPKQDNEDEKNKNSNLLTTTNEVLQDSNSVNIFPVNEIWNENKKWSFLKYGNEIRYWFYRLEYYLWRDREQSKFKDENFGENTIVFLSIANNFYFRNLNSVEHFQPQSEPNEKWWLKNPNEMDAFGNLALISGSFNSKLGKQSIEKKKIDIKEQGNIESLKLFLMCCLEQKMGKEQKVKEERKGKAEIHQEQMLEILKQSLQISSHKLTP